VVPLSAVALSFAAAVGRYHLLPFEVFFFNCIFSSAGEGSLEMPFCSILSADRFVEYESRFFPFSSGPWSSASRCPVGPPSCSTNPLNGERSLNSKSKSDAIRACRIM